MNRKFLCLLVMQMVLRYGAATSAEPEATGSTLSVAEARQVVELHNAARKEVDVQAVVWSPELAKFAQAWADEVARTGKFEHRPGEGEWARKYGENIAIGSGETFTAAEGFDYWLAEKKDYEPGTPIPEDFSEFKAGHYSQIVWRETKRIGLGRAVLQTGELKGMTVIVANYDPPGNVTGEKPF